MTRHIKSNWRKKTIISIGHHISNEAEIVHFKSNRQVHAKLAGFLENQVAELA